MSQPIIEYDYAEMEAAVTRLYDHNGPLAIAAAGLELEIPNVTSEASAFESEWEPEGVYGEKEVTSFMENKAREVRVIAEEIRSLAKTIVAQANSMSEVQDQGVIDLDGIDMDPGGLTPGYGT